MNECELLRRFADENAQDAFATLVQAKINLVYAAALRQVGGDVHLAQDVTQGVFLALASQAGKLKKHPMLTGWLFTTTRFLATKALRGQRRWRDREREANAAYVATDSSDAAWRELRPIIDDALHELDAKDRAVLLLRFFEDRNHADIAAALGFSENAVRMRTDRALEKLRIRLVRRGVTSTAVALGATMSCHAATVAPAGLAASVTNVAIAGAGLGLVTSSSVAGATLFKTMSTLKIVLGTAAAVALFGVGTYVGGHATMMRNSGDDINVNREASLTDLRAENARLKALVVQLGSAKSSASAQNAADGAEGDLLAGRNKWKLLAELTKQKIVSARISFIDSAGNLNVSMASLFDLTPDEQATLTRQIDAARGKIEVLEKANATVTDQSYGKILITVKPFPQAGAPVYDELMAGIAQTLGQERNAAFATLCADQVEKALGAFGAAERTVTVTSQPESKSSRYLASDEQVAPHSHSTNSSNYMSREELLQRVGTVTKLLPADF